ncbi:alpha/beta hydrolase fold domain-containing protein [Actinoplanes sp. NPDC023714]|uniref:alpha/beta hydrolase fold domain-containing protein n=1 Tax=Actinoplanes sp. NPDC023714 TaxID=3154322 RepID=UPI0033D3A39C
MTATGTVLGYAMKGLHRLPRTLRRAVLLRAAGGDLPAVPDYVRMLEIAGDLPETGPTDAELFDRFPQLAAVTVTEQPAGVPAMLYRGPGTPAAGLVWVHGGAFVSGSLRMAEAHFTALALAARGIAVLTVGYRKALRGVRYPAGSDDVLTGWLWAVMNADRFGVPAERLHLGGASAGASLAAGVAKRLRDGAGQPPASLALIYPSVHAALPPWEPAELAAIRGRRAVFFSPEWVAAMSRHYCDDLGDPYAFPANGEVAGLPRTLIVNCEHDTLRSSGEAFADRLRAAGVPVTVHLAPNAVHGCLGEPFTVAATEVIDVMQVNIISP